VTTTRISDSCGYGVPVMDHVGDRDLLERWAARKSDDDITAYVKAKNLTSIDGLPAVPNPVPATG
jgi:hypothetical protein